MYYDLIRLYSKRLIMYRYIRSYTYVDYNTNPRGTMTGDCQTRAIAMAFDMSWDDARKALRRVGKDWYSSAFLVRKTLTDEFGCTKVDVDLDDHSPDKDYLSVAEFCDTVGKSGTYLVVCTSDVKHDYGTHIVCTINGTLYDTWNSSKCRVTEVYKPTGKYRTEELKIESDIPDKIWRIALKYETCFDDAIRDYDVDAKIAELIPSLSSEDIYNISKQMTVTPKLADDSVHSFNFVIELHPNIYIYKPISYKLTRKKSYNISFSTEETVEDALAGMQSKVSKLVDDYFTLVITNIRSRLDVSEDLGKLHNLHLTSTQLEAYKTIPTQLRSKIIRLETFCGYTSAIVDVSPENLPGCYVLVISKLPKYLGECVRICINYGYDNWNDYNTPKINVLPHGFTYSLRRYQMTDNRDKKEFKEFLESYEDYLWNIEHNEGHGLDWYFADWNIPKMLKAS